MVSVLLLALTVPVLSEAHADKNSFIITWTTTIPSEPITISAGWSGSSFTIDWGDEAVNLDVSGDQTHAYETSGTHTVSISGGFRQIRFNNKHPGATKITTN